ncbi:MAG: S-layer homology domain-containing protein [Acidaminococcaceae bacterium]|nr:S-layer homology domain-containing protein [Acidaminococcaceae bacterium]
MKKSLVLAMAMALGVTASAYAANPFSDVPAGHWAYDSISKLAAAGIIEGYGDDTFRGDRLMTRYEMAQIVAKALAKGANVDKLAAEFADELDALGVRVAALEKKSDNVKITGQARWRYRTDTKGTTTHDLRTRLWFTGKVNDNWNYVSMIENTQTFNESYTGEDDKTYFQRAYLQGRLGGAKITAGRYHEELAGGDSDVYSNRIDGIKAQYGDKVRLMGWYGKMAKLNGKDADPGNKKSWGAHLGFDLGKAADLFVGYDELENALDAKRKIFDVGANLKFGDVKATAIYLHGKRGGDDVDLDTDKKNGFTFQLAYKGAQAAKPGSWGLVAKYYNQGNLTYVDHAAFTGKGGFTAADASGFKGFRIGGDYTVAKNMVARVAYFDLKGKGDNAEKRKTYYGEMIITF